MEVILRAEAEAKGLIRYFTGKPCPHGHISERNVKSRNCIECVAAHGVVIFARKYASDPEFVARRKAKTKEWKQAHPEVGRAHSKRWSKENPERARAMLKEWQQKNPDKVRAYQKKWLTDNPGKRKQYHTQWETNDPTRAAMVKRASNINRRAKVATNGGTCTGAELTAIRAAQKGRCAGCRKKAPLTIDHIIPIHRGGTGDANNLQFLCMPCNQEKSARDPIEWAQSNGRLL